MVRKKVQQARYFGIGFLFISILLVGAIYFFNRGQLQDIRSNAQENANYCATNCGGDKDPCTGTKIGDNFYDPECCAEIKKTGDPFACGNWVNRTWCFPDDCSTIPEGVKGQRCASARTEYCNRCKAYGCYNPASVPTPISTAVPATLMPMPTAVPTEVPQPTSFPPSPTQIVLPTQVIQNPTTQVTYIPVQYPTNPPPVPPTLAPTKIPNILSLPNLFPPKEKVDSFFIKIRTNIFDFFSKILP